MKSSATTARRLWTYLVHQESVQDIFIRAVFGKRRSLSALDEVLPHPEPTAPEPVRIIHKEQDSIAAFSLNQVIYYHQGLHVIRLKQLGNVVLRLITFRCLQVLSKYWDPVSLFLSDRKRPYSLLLIIIAIICYA